MEQHLALISRTESCHVKMNTSGCYGQMYTDGLTSPTPSDVKRRPPDAAMVADHALYNRTRLYPPLKMSQRQPNNNNDNRMSQN